MDKKFIQLDEGIKIAYQSYGDGENTIVLFHGLVGGSRLNPETISAIDDSNTRVIALERIGYGDSSQLELKSVGGWKSFICQIFSKLNIKKAEAVGISAGAPYAYTAASALPDKVTRVWILSGVPAVYEEFILECYSEKDQQFYKNFLQTDLPEIQNYYRNHMESVLKQFNDAPPYIVETLEEIIAQNCYGMSLESKLQITPWDIDFESINQHITMFHSPDDEMIPFNAAKEMASRLKDCSFRKMEITGNNIHIESSAAAFLQILKTSRQQY
ncbi:MAG: alpha/beta fold hydrolase [Draconibacterium sp.]